MAGLFLVTKCEAFSWHPGWHLVWHDEFNKNGPPDPANWSYERGFVRNHELQWYQPDNAYCTNGLLILEARQEHRPNPSYRTNASSWTRQRQWIDYTSASINTRDKREFLHGKFEMRARIDVRQGSWPAFWTLGSDVTGVGWPACGEVDIMEFYAGNVLANIAYRSNSKAKWSTVKKPVAGLGGEQWAKRFHIWTMNWETNTIDLLLDGKLMNHMDLTNADTADYGNPFRRPQYLLLNLAIGSNGGDPSHTRFPIRYEMDWVRVYQRNPGPPQSGALSINRVFPTKTASAMCMPVLTSETVRKVSGSKNST